MRVCPSHFAFQNCARSDVSSKLVIKATFVGSDVDPEPSNTQHKLANLPIEKRSTDSTRRENVRSEPPSNGELIVSLEERPLSEFCIAGQVDLISVAGSGAKILLHIVKESADVFTPLKSVLGGICAICEQYEVCLRTPARASLVSDTCPQKTVAVKQKIEVILLRVDVVEALLDSPIGDKGEEMRRNNLLRFGHRLSAKENSLSVDQ